MERLFLEHATRRVAKDGTLTLRGKTFEAGPFWIGERVSVLFDPFDLRKVVVVGKDGRAEDAFPVDLSGNRRVRRDPPREPAPETKGPPLRAFEDLADRLEEDAGHEEGKEKSDEA
jgi:hypothetical protein